MQQITKPRIQFDEEESVAAHDGWRPKSSLVRVQVNIRFRFCQIQISGLSLLTLEINSNLISRKVSECNVHCTL